MEIKKHLNSLLMLQKMNMMAVGLNGVLLVNAVGPGGVIVKEHGRDIAIHPGHLKEAYHVLDPIHGQSIATVMPLVSVFRNQEILFRI